ncbi:MAG TPA: ubiquinol-cytochrome c reductase iron-sulfur subunit [Kofleriaceae bacterium]|jgi:Rieske Fe-S protein
MVDDPKRRGADADRRAFLTRVTCGAIGAGVGYAVGVPVIKLILDPVGKQVVTTPREALDIGSIGKLTVNAPPTRIEIIAPTIKDAWTAQSDVLLGAAWVRRTSETEVKAYSAVCPHLGCAVGWEGQSFLCPCHDSKFAADGTKMTGPSERGLDELPIQIDGDRLKLTWVRYKLGQEKKEPA